MAGSSGRPAEAECGLDVELAREKMRTLHVAPGDSAAGSLLQAIRDAGRDDGVLAHPDDLSCGPIAPDDPSSRAAWWTLLFGKADELKLGIEAFWARVEETDDRLVVWFGRHSAQELAFFLAWANRLGERPYDIVDVTGMILPFSRGGGSFAAKAVSIVPSESLRSLLGKARPPTLREREEACRQWRRLAEENAPHRVVTTEGLVSAPADHFDASLLERATTEWQRLVSIVADALAHNSESHFQVGVETLLARVATLIREGSLLADGDTRDMHSCRIRLPG